MPLLERWTTRLLAPWGFLLRFADRPWYPMVRDVLLGVAVACLGTAAGLIIAAPWEGPAPPVGRVRIGGIEVETGHARPEALMRLVRQRLRSPVVLKGTGHERRTTWADLGARVDLAALDRVLVDLARADSASARYFQAEKKKPGALSIPLPVSLGPEAAVESLVALKDTLDRKPENARFDFASDKVRKEREGVVLDVFATLERMDVALGSGANEVVLALDSVPAQVTEKDLAAIDVDSVLGFFETPYSRMAKDRDRTYNVQLGSSRLDGQVILPGEAFSFNDALGERSEARGFRYAPVIAGGALVEGMGGGTCQVASTLYAASFFTGLIVVERQSHSRPSAYIKLGLDATVSYPDINLEIKNPFEFPVVIHFTAKDGVLRAELRGKERRYTVTLLRRIVGTAPFPVRTVDDPLLAKGKEIITQNGIPGYTVMRYQVIEGSKVGYRFTTVDKYPATAEIIHRGAAEPGTLAKNVEGAPKPDSHAPYHASNFVRVVQGPKDLWYEQSHD